MKYFVSRQRYWPDGDLFVEVAVGGLDYANPGMLTQKFINLGEGKEFSDPRKAAKAAINIRDAWKKINQDEEINIGCGCTGGMTMPFDACEDEELIKWAEKRFEAAEKCDWCGDIMPDNGKWQHDFSPDFQFCSENCANLDYEEYMKIDDEERAGFDLEIEEEERD